MYTEEPTLIKSSIVTSFWAALGLSALSGVLIALSMPNFDIWPLAWVALVPLLIALERQPGKRKFFISLPFGLIWSIAVHNWYPFIFPTWLGYFLILMVAAFYAGVISLGKVLQERLVGALQVLILPTVWTAIEWLRFVAPVTSDWWFVLLANSQWQFPPALQILSLTGFPGLTFIIVLFNMALAILIVSALRRQKFRISAIAALAVPIIIVAWGAIVILRPPPDTFTIAATTDMVNQDVEIQASGEFSDAGYIADTPEMSQAIFDVNAKLSRRISATANPAFIVWPENEFADITDTAMIGQLEALAQELNVYIVADVVWRTPEGMYDTALMVGPNGQEIGRRAKINITSGEAVHGFTRGPDNHAVFDTPYGKASIAVCWDRHRTDILRNLARNGAQIVLLPVDDDFDTRWFPAFHAADSVFRAAENRLAMGLGTTSGISQVIDPYGRITAKGDLYKREVISGPTFTVVGQTLYTRLGDWFGILVSVSLGIVIVWSIATRRHK